MPIEEPVGRHANLVYPLRLDVMGDMGDLTIREEHVQCGHFLFLPYLHSCYFSSCFRSHKKGAAKYATLRGGNEATHLNPGGTV